MRRPSAAWMASAILMILERNLRVVRAWAPPPLSSSCGSTRLLGRYGGPEPHVRAVATSNERNCGIVTAADLSCSFRRRSTFLHLSNVSSSRRGVLFRLHATASSSSSDAAASTPAAASSSASTTLFMDVSEAKRKAMEALELYKRNVGSTTPLDTLTQQLSDLEREQSEPSFWDESNSQRATTVNNMIRTKSRLLSRLQRWRGWEGDILAALEMLRPDNLPSLTSDDATMLLEELQQATQSLLRESTQYELELLLSGPYDAYPARLVLTCGAGGTESNDWVSDLYRMYRRHCDAMGFRVIVEDEQPGDVTGYKSVELIVEGDNAYGWLQGEKGAHRLVRLSPFNANNKRQTTFAGVDVAPLLDETVLDIDVPESDLEITAMRAGGKGGQNVNKVNSAVRIKHIPSGLQVRCAQERSQVQNKDIALRRLKSQLLAIAQEQRVQEVAEIRGDQVEASWGAQIRNYVLHPYRLVKDQRTGWETSNVQSVLDGDLEECIGAYLRHKAAQEAESAATNEDGS